MNNIKANDKHVTILKNSKGRKRDLTHDYYIIEVDKKKCTSNCGKTFSLATSTTVLKRHLSKKHNIKAQDQDKDDETTKNQLENENIIELAEKDVCKAFSIAFAKNSLPYSLFKNKYFCNALNLYKQIDAKLTPYKLKEETLQIGNETEKDIIAKLSLNQSPVTLAVDGWTNVRSNKVINLLLISNGVSYFYSSIENNEKHNDAVWLSSQLEVKIIKIIKEKVNVVAITTDNENLMKATCKKLKEVMPFLIDIPCSAHLMQLCLKSVLSIPKIHKIINEILDVVNIIKNSKENRKQLEELQITGKSSDVLTIIRPIEIRWASLISCIERLLLLRKYIDIIITNLNESFWKNTNDLYIYLKPFKTSIDQIQKDNASLYCVSQNIQKIRDHFSSAEIPKSLRTIKKTVLDLINEKWDKHINMKIMNVIRFLNFEKDQSIYDSAVDFIEQWGSLYLTTFKIVPENDIEQIKDKLNFQVLQFIGSLDKFSSLNTIIERNKRTCINLKKQFNPTIIWISFLSSYFALAKVAIALLSICPSEACVERSFSMQSDVHSLDRNRLLPELIEAEMKIKYNFQN
jgi:hypothetical protein